MIERSQRSGFTIEPTPNHGPRQFNGAACDPSGSCIVVGTGDSGSVITPLIERDPSRASRSREGTSICRVVLAIMLADRAILRRGTLAHRAGVHGRAGAGGVQLIGQWSDPSSGIDTDNGLRANHADCRSADWLGRDPKGDRPGRRGVRRRDRRRDEADRLQWVAHLHAHDCDCNGYRARRGSTSQRHNGLRSRFLDHAAAYAAAKTLFRDDPDLLLDVKPADLPEYFEAHTAAGSGPARFVARYGHLHGVTNVTPLNFCVTAKTKKQIEQLQHHLTSSAATVQVTGP